MCVACRGWPGGPAVGGLGFSVDQRPNKKNKARQLLWNWCTRVDPVAIGPFSGLVVSFSSINICGVVT